MNWQEIVKKYDLDVSIVNFDELIGRIDAEYYKLEYLEIEKKLNLNGNSLSKFGINIYHPNKIKREYVQNDGVLFIRAQNVRPLKLDLSNVVLIAEKDALKLKKNLIREKDILMTRTGANFGQSCIFMSKKKAIASSHTLIIRSGEINPFF